METLVIKHHGAVEGVTGSCHELCLDDNCGILIDCGLFQGAETSGTGADFLNLQIDFPISHIKALVVTHVHIDHVGRIPYLLAAGFKGPIVCSQPSAQLLPLVLEDAVKVGFTRDTELVKRFLGVIRKRVIGIPYKHWFSLLDEDGRSLRVRLQPAGHILGSAFVECDAAVNGLRGQRASNLKVRRGQSPSEMGSDPICQRVVFSGDLGAPYAPLLPAPRSPDHCDTLVIESTYGDRLHENRKSRKARLKKVLEHCLRDDGVVLIPAFSIGRTQEILYELEGIISVARHRGQKIWGQSPSATGSDPIFSDPGVNWDRLAIIVDSPLASRFTETYRKLKPFWDQEALAALKRGRDPLDFDQLVTIGGHRDHERLVRRLQKHGGPCVVIAASGMCAGGRIVNYLKALLGQARTDVVFVGYQAEGTAGRDILRYAGSVHKTNAVNKKEVKGARNIEKSVDSAPLKGEPYVVMDGERYAIRAGIHQLSGYSAHADQVGLVNFVKGMRRKPSEVRIVHGDDGAKQVLRGELKGILPDCKVWIPGRGIKEKG